MMHYADTPIARLLEEEGAHVDLILVPERPVRVPEAGTSQIFFCDLHLAPNITHLASHTPGGPREGETDIRHCELWMHEGTTLN